MDIVDYKLQKNGVEHFWYRAKREFIYKWLLNKYKKSVDRKILDIGCGCGAEIETLKSFGQVEGLEINKEAATIAKKNDIEVMVGDIADIEIKEKYNTICFFDLLEHVKEDKEALKNIFSGLESGGDIFMSVPALVFLFGSHDRALGHYRRYSKKDIVRKLSEAGFSNIEITYWNSILSPLIIVWRLMGRLILSKKNPKPDSSLPHPIINNMFYLIMKLENFLYFKGVRLPIGISLMISAKKNES